MSNIDVSYGPAPGSSSFEALPVGSWFTTAGGGLFVKAEWEGTTGGVVLSPAPGGVNAGYKASFTGVEVIHVDAAVATSVHL